MYGFFLSLSLSVAILLSVARKVGADFWEEDEDSNFSVFRVQRFTEWPGPLH